MATAAVRLAVPLSFTELGLHRLDAGVMPSNLASQRVLENAGFTLIGLSRGHLYIRGRWEDHLLYEIVGPDVAPDMTG